VAQASDLALRLLEPLLSRLPPVAIPRLHRALGCAFAQHPGVDRAALFERAVDHYKKAADGWDPEDVRGYLMVHHDLAHEYWRVQDFLPDTEQLCRQAVDVLQRALSHPRLPEFRVEHAMLLRLRGMVEHYRYGNPYAKRRSAAKKEALRWLKQAYEICPSDDVQERYQVVLSLANVERDLANDLVQEQEPLREAAIRHYHEALGLQDERAHLHEIDIARGQKCLADALLHRRHPGDLAEAQRLLFASLEVRKELPYPVPQVESLLSLAQVELARHEEGEPGALDAAQDAVRQGLALLPKGAEGLRYQLQALLMQATERAGAQAAVGPVPDHDYLARQRAAFLLGLSNDEIEDQRGDLAWIIDNELSGRRSKGLLARDTQAQLDAMAALRKQYGGGPGAEIPAAPVLSRLRHRLAKGIDMGLVHDLLAPQAASRDWAPEDRSAYRQILAEAVQAARAAHLPWDSLAVLEHQSAFLYFLDKGRLTYQEWRAAEDWARQSRRAVHERDPENPDLIELSRDLGLIIMLGPMRGQPRRFAEARSLLEEALRLARQHQDQRMQAHLSIDLATLLDHMADDDPSLRDQAIAVYSELLDGASAARLSDHAKSMALANRGWSRVNLPRARHPEALRLAVADLEEAVRVCGDSRQIKAQRAHAVQHLASALCELSCYDPAQRARTLQCAEEALRLYKELNDDVEQARCHHILGLFLLRFGGPEGLPRAIEFMLQALRHRRHNPIEFWETLGNLVLARLRMPVPFSEMPVDQTLLADVDGLIATLRAPGLSQRLLMAHRYGLWLLSSASQHDTVQLLHRVEAALQDAEAMWIAASTPGERQALTDALASFAAERVVLGFRAGERPIELLHHAQRGKARGLLHDQEILVQTSRSPKQMAREAELQAQIRALPVGGDAEASHRRLALSMELHQLRMSAASACWPKIDEAALRERLLREQQAALIDISLAATGSIALVAHLDRERELVLRAHELPVNGPDVMRWLRGDDSKDGGWLGALHAYKQALEKREDPLPALEAMAAQLENLLQLVHEHLVGPAIAGLQADGVIDLILCVHGPLCMVPLSASGRLTSDGALRYLIEDFRSVRLIPSVAAFLREGQAAARPPRRGLIFTAQDLRGAEADGEKIRAIWHQTGLTVRVLRESARPATIDAVLEGLREADLAYLLCHGVFVPGDPGRSGLLLSQQALLSVAALAERSQPLRAQQIFLASCHAGRVTDGEVGAEWFGLAGQLLRCGARVVIAALWDVFYESSVTLSNEYFTALLSRSLPPAQALGEATRALLAHGRMQSQSSRTLSGRASRLLRLQDSPISWAGFILLGLD
jgi:CHAT domain-containing protein